MAGTLDDEEYNERLNVAMTAKWPHELAPLIADQHTGEYVNSAQIAGLLAAGPSYPEQRHATVLRLGYRYRVPTTGLTKALKIEQIPVYLDDADQGAAVAARFS